MKLLTLKARTLWEARPTSGRAVYFVSDNAGWAIEQYARYTSHGIRRTTPLAARYVSTIPRVRGQIVHFADRYRFLDACPNELARDNDIYVTWFHGGRHEGFDKTLDRLTDRLDVIRGIVTSCSLGKTALRDAGIPEEKLSVIPLGTDTRLFRPASQVRRVQIRKRLGIPDNAICVGSFQKDGNGWGNGDEPKLIKGPDLFIDVVTRLHNRMPRLFVLLTGPARGYVVNGLRRAGIPYIHHDVKQYRSIPAYYRALDLYLISSRCEGGPLALPEAWASGCPVVTTPVGIAADVVQDGTNALMAAAEDVDELANCCERLIGDDPLADSLRQRALHDVQSLDWNILAKRYYAEVYSPCLVRARGSASCDGS